MGTATISVTLIIIFFVLGFILPFAQEGFGNVITTQGTDKLSDDIAEQAGNLNVVSLGTIILSVLKMFFWTFGDLPFWLDGFFVILRIVMVWTGALALRGVA